MNSVLTNHYYGEYASEGYTLQKDYRNRRLYFKEFLMQLNEEYRLNFIQEQLNEYKNEFIEKYPDCVDLLINAQNLEDYYKHIEFDEIYFKAGFFFFMKVMESQYIEFERIKVGELKCLKDYNSFKELYFGLSKYNIIECDFLQFKRFFSLKEKISFNGTAYEITHLFHKLISKEYISELTFNSMVGNNHIIFRNARLKKEDILNNSRVINTSSYIKSKKKAYQIKETMKLFYKELFNEE